MTRLQETRALARAFKRLDAAEQLLAQRKAEFDAVYQQWAVDRVISRDMARKQLVSTGFLEPSKVCCRDPNPCPRTSDPQGT